MSAIHIRDKALPGDAGFILQAFDSALPHLASIGSGAQWGTEPRSTQEIYVERIRAAIEKIQSGSSEEDALFVAEVPIDEGSESMVAMARKDEGSPHTYLLPVAAAMVTGSFSSYIGEQPHLNAYVQTATEQADFLYLSAMVSDFRVGALRKGAGTALIQRVKQYAYEKGKNAVYCDCWQGNGGKLVGFYESQGFVSVDDFQAKKEDGSLWPGKLLRMDIDKNNGNPQ